MRTVREAPHAMPLLPALLALSSILPSLLGPVVVTFVLLRVTSVVIPLPLIALLYAASIPVFFFSRSSWRRHRNRREADKLGAVLPPWVEDRSWLGFGVMKAQIAALERGYMGNISIVIN